MQWPRSTSAAAKRWPTLKALEFPRGKENATKCMRAFATDLAFIDDRTMLIKKLQAFADKAFKGQTAKITRDDASLEPGRSSTTPSTLDDEISHLFRALQKYTRCNDDNKRGSVVTKVRLRGYGRLPLVSPNHDLVPRKDFALHDALAEFGVLFLDHPHVAGSRWQEARIQICDNPRSKTTKM